MRFNLFHGANADRVQAIDALIDGQRDLRQGHKILHGFPPPVAWRERDVSVDEVMALHRDTATAAKKGLNLYIGSPYCLPTRPDRCGFCIFPSEEYVNRSQLDEYLGLLEIEGRMYREFFDDVEVASIYFGGGTTNLYRPAQLLRLGDIVRGVFGPLPDSVEVSVDGIPQLYTREILDAMQAAGINRISIGVQQLEDDMIALSGRRQTSRQVFDAIDSCHELGLACSVDMIFGWPTQTVDRMLGDLRALVAAGVRHITHYELNVAARTAFARELADRLPSRRENLEMYRVGRDYLAGEGYRQRTAYDWEKAANGGAAFRYEQEWHRPLRAGDDDGLSGLDMWGWGFAGVSSFLGTPQVPGWTYINCTRLDDYRARLDAGLYPIERGYRYRDRELRLNVLFQMLQAMSIDLAEYRRLFGLDLLEEHAEVFSALASREWIEVEGDRLDLVGDGVFYTALVQSLLSKPERYWERVSRPADETA